MISILSNFRHRAGGGGHAFVDVPDSVATVSPNLESVNMSNQRGGLRVANPQGLRVVLFSLFILAVLPFWGQEIEFESSNYNDGDKVSVISEITLSFDFSAVAESLGIEESELGIGSMLLNRETYRLLIYKGKKSAEYVGVQQEPSTCEYIVGYGFKTIAKNAVVAGEHSITVPLNSPITLEPGEYYTIYVPAGMLMAAKPGTLYNATKYTSPIIIQVEGENAQGEILQMVSAIPATESQIDILSAIEIEFNKKVVVSENCVASVLNNNNECYSSSQIVANDNIITINFDNVKLYNGKDYIVSIPSGAFISEDGSLSSDAISLFYNGGAYNYMTTGRVSPSTRNPISWLTNVNIPFDFPEGYNIGNVNDVTMKLYEGSMDNEPTIVSCTSDATLSSLVANVWKFDLKPSTSYYLVLDKETIFPARTDDYRIKLKDTTNDEVVLEYTTPEELERPATVTLASSTPTNMSGVEKLEDVVVELSKYEFDGTNYDVNLSVDDPIAIFNDGTTETNVPLTFDPETSKATISINRPLEADKEYTLTIPANTFAPIVNENLAAIAGNKEIVLTYNGVAAKKYKVTCEFVGFSAMSTIVESGKTATYTLTAPQDWKVESVKFNGEDVELVNDEYTTPAIEDDATIEVEYAYAEEIQFMDLTTGVDTINVDGSNYTVGKDGDYVVIYNAAKGDLITVYTVGGMQMASHIADNDTVKILLPSGIYIVRINNVTFKIQH